MCLIGNDNEMVSSLVIRVIGILQVKKSAISKETANTCVWLESMTIEPLY